MMTCRSGILTLAVLIGIASHSIANDAQWRAGFARRNITPHEPVFLAGYASRNRPHDSVESELFVKAMALQDSSGKRALLVTSDLIGYRRGAAEIICERVQSETGLVRSEIILNSSHTHTGPSLLVDADDRSDSMSLEQAQRQVAWTQELIDLTVAAGLEALDHLAPAQLSYGVGLAPFVMNRREWTADGVRLGFNPAGYADRSVPILRIEAPDGTLRGVVFGAATHNTTLGVRYLEWVHDPDPSDCTYVAEYATLLRDAAGATRVVHDRHLEGLFPRATWLRLFADAGFATRIVHDPWGRDLFVGRRR